MATKRAVGRKGITLRDVIFHIQGVKQDLSQDVRHMEQRLSKRIDDVERGLTTRMNEVETNLTERIKDSDRDIMAVMTDTVNIRRHVGMALPDDE